MISTRRFGRCGNAMYMYAHVIALSKKFNIPFHFPKTTDNPKWSPIYFLEYANPNWREGVEDVLINEQWNREQHYQEIEWKDEWNGKQVVLNGFWQSYLYFDWCRDEILKVFNFPYEFKQDYCSIHVRRGDYLLYPTIHPVVTMEYINKTIDYILKNTSVKRFMVFSDDIGWCKENIKRNEHIEFSEGRNEIDDLTLMSHCEHNICSNSTMALWGAELNQNPNKVVITPHEDNWFGEKNKHLSVKDLFRPEWVKIKY